MAEFQFDCNSKKVKSNVPHVQTFKIRFIYVLENFKITEFPFVEIRRFYLISILIKKFGNSSASRNVFHLASFLFFGFFSLLKTLVIKVLVCNCFAVLFSHRYWVVGLLILESSFSQCHYAFLFQNCLKIVLW